MWAGYKQGSLGGLFAGGLDIDGFKQTLAEFIEADLFCWVCEADTKRGRVPVGIAIGRPFVHGTLIMGNFSWFSWASKRNVYESVVNLVNDLRKEAPLIFHVDETAKKLAVQLARHGIMRRVGTSHVTGEPLSVFESK